MKKLKPKISAWYADSINGDVFEIIAIDEQADIIEYQLIDGEMGEFDIATWDSLKLKRTQPPSDWSASLEDVIGEDEDVDTDDYSGMIREYEQDIPDFDDDAYSSQHDDHGW